jgi:hypothetical protein
MSLNTSVRRLTGNDMDGQGSISGKDGHVSVPFGVEGDKITCGAWPCVDVSSPECSAKP